MKIKRNKIIIKLIWLLRKFFKHKTFFLSVILFVAFVIFEIYSHKNDRNCENEKIDVVYTWVNGSDPKFLENLNNYLKDINETLININQRYEDKQELKFSLRSLEKHAPWVNHIFLVTNGQIPSWLNLDYEKITLVTHSEIFLDRNDLPTFSSPAIESHLHRIPGLSSKFIYFNDDIFLGAPVYYEDFYTHNEGFKIFLAWPVPNCFGDCRWIFVGDEQCDEMCNNEECQFDGGDCEKAQHPRPGAPENDYVNEDNFNNPKDNAAIVQSLPKGSPTNDNLPKTNITKMVEQHNEKILLNNKIIRKRHLRKDRHKELLKRQTKGNLINDSKPKKTQDLYIQSVQYSNRVFNNKYGFVTRMIASHAPLLIDKDIMEKLEVKFVNEMLTTSRNRIRSTNDMQYTFTYYNFLIHETVDISVGDIFDTFDTDNSGTWSDREIRTLLTQIYELPLNIAMVETFETMLNNCSMNFPEVSTPKFERYLDSKLKTTSRETVINCRPVAKILKNYFGKSDKYKHEQVKNAEKDFISFKMMRSNLSDVVAQFDDIRSMPKKFICLNDNLDPTKEEENELIKSVLYDFYLSFFPNPSKFELDEDYRNRFLYIEDLQRWRRSNQLVKIVTIVLFLGLVYFVINNFGKRRLCQVVNKVFG